MSYSTITNNLNFLKSATSQIKTPELKAMISTKITGVDKIFSFDVILRENIKLESDITDHYVEDNTTINDNISLKPIIITVSGLVGEKTFKVSDQQDIFSVATEKLSAFSSFAPELTTQANQINNQKKKIFNAIDNAQSTYKNIYGLFNDLELEAEPTNQSKAFSFLLALRDARQIFTLETPYKTFENMAILSIDINQEDTTSKSNFELTMKQLNFSKKINTTLNSQGRLAQQKSGGENKGKTKGTEKNKSLVLQIINLLKK
ncbi:hypothetical protein EOM39_01345 [Candidatus Gracilibacteria bacterium]|nr:hypothetical protein [Candidatus Gracilibacteria bacterium]